MATHREGIIIIFNASKMADISLLTRAQQGSPFKENSRQFPKPVGRMCYIAWEYVL